MSSIVDNIPLTSMMLKIIASIIDNPKVNVPMLPLVLSLAFAGGFGGCRVYFEGFFFQLMYIMVFLL